MTFPPPLRISYYFLFSFFFSLFPESFFFPIWLSIVINCTCVKYKKPFQNKLPPGLDSLYLRTCHDRNSSNPLSLSLFEIELVCLYTSCPTLQPSTIWFLPPCVLLFGTFARIRITTLLAYDGCTQNYYEWRNKYYEAAAAAAIRNEERPQRQNLRDGQGSVSVSGSSYGRLYEGMYAKIGSMVHPYLQALHDSRRAWTYHGLSWLRTPSLLYWLIPQRSRSRSRLEGLCLFCLLFCTRRRRRVAAFHYWFSWTTTPTTKTPPSLPQDRRPPHLHLRRFLGRPQLLPPHDRHLWSLSHSVPSLFLFCFPLLPSFLFNSCTQLIYLPTYLLLFQFGTSSKVEYILFPQKKANLLILDSRINSTALLSFIWFCS